MTVPVRVRRLPHNQDLPLPCYATDGAAGMDLVAAVTEPVVASTAPATRPMTALKANPGLGHCPGSRRTPSKDNAKCSRR
jgi:hypothetical protein